MYSATIPCSRRFEDLSTTIQTVLRKMGWLELEPDWSSDQLIGSTGIVAEPKDVFGFRTGMACIEADGDRALRVTVTSHGLLHFGMPRRQAERLIRELRSADPEAFKASALSG